MAMRPPNQQSGGTGTTVTAKAPKKSSPAGGTAAPTSGKGKYQWATGGKVHSVSQATHDQSVRTQQTLGTQDLTAPPTGAQAVTEANSAADLQFGPQIAAAQQQQANVAPWFRDYLARVAGYATAAQKLAAPVIDQAQGYQQGAAAQMPAGLDPNSAAGQQAAQAAQGRAALAQLGLDALNTNATATQDFFGGQQAAAAKDEPGAQTAAANALAGAQSQRGAAVNGFLTTARQNAQNYAIARGTLNLNNDKAAADVAQTTATTTEKVRHDKASETASADRTAASTQSAADRAAAAAAAPNKYGVPAGQWDHWSTSHRQRAMDAFNEKAATGSTEKAAAKHVADVHAASGAVQNTITDIQDAWARGGTMPAPTSKDKNATRPMTRQELRTALGAKYGGTMVAIMERVRAGQPLTTAQIDYLHNTNPNVRIPHAWLPTAGGNQAPAAPANPFASTNPLVTTHP